MFETNTAANGAGLAANQIGVDLRVFVYDCADDERVAAPGRRGQPGDRDVRGAGDHARPGRRLGGLPVGARRVVPDRQGALGEGHRLRRGRQPIEVEGTGYLARCFQHETDHLNGLLYLDRLVGRNAREAKRMLKQNRWGVPGLSWDPATAPDPFA